MYYTELLRVFRALRVYAIILLVLLILAALARLASGGLTHMLTSQSMMHDPGAVRTTQTLQDGTKVVRVVNAAKHQSLEVRTAPDGTTAEVVHDTSRGTPGQHDTSLSFGIVNMHEHHDRSGDTTVVVKSGGLDLELLLAIALPGAMIIATILAGVLTKENQGHLELAWTKPISREAYALLMMGVDVAGILAVILLGIVYQLIETSFWLVPHIWLTPQSGTLGGLAILLPIAWYALLTACGASLKQTLGVIVGTAWPVAAFLLIFSGINFGSAPVANFISLAFRTIDTLNPLAYAIQIFNHTRFTLVPPSVASSIAALAVITLVSIAAAVLQWRRVEA